MTLAWDHEGKGSFAVAGGWLATAERLLADLDEAPEHGRLILMHALTALFHTAGLTLTPYWNWFFASGSGKSLTP